MRIRFFCLALIIFELVNGQVNDANIVSFIPMGLVTSHNPDSIFHYKWDANSQNWNPDKRYALYYNSNAVKTLEETSNWINYTWEAADRIEYIYIDSLLINQNSSWWDWPYSEWVPTVQSALKYDSLNNLIEKYISIWSIENSDWVNDSIYNYEYDSVGNCTTLTLRLWTSVTNNWENYSQIIYVYDGLSNNTKQIHYLWDVAFEIWQAEKIINYNFNIDNLLTWHEQLEMNSFHTDWENIWRREYKYIGNNLIQEEIYFVWGLFDGDYKWIENYNTIYKYDENENILETTQYYFDWDLLIWSNQFQILNTYFDVGFLNTSTYYYWNFGQWNELEKYNYYYPGFVSIRTIPNFCALNIYPNPAKEHITIFINNNLQEKAQIELYDLNGQLVYSMGEYFSNSQIEINLPDLINGVYILKAIMNNEIFSTKLIICK